MPDLEELKESKGEEAQQIPSPTPEGNMIPLPGFTTTAPDTIIQEWEGL